MHHDELNTYEQNLLNEVLQRAATDLGFRERLLNEPHRVLAEIPDQELPRDFVIRFKGQGYRRLGRSPGPSSRDGGAVWGGARGRSGRTDELLCGIMSRRQQY